MEKSRAIRFSLVEWKGIDEHSGVALFNVYVSDNGGDFQLWLTNTPLTSYEFVGVPGHQYDFYCLVTDHAGNMEDKTPLVEATAGSMTPQIAAINATIASKGCRERPVRWW